MSLNIKPLSDRVVIEPLAAETTTASGIIIPDTAKEKPQKRQARDNRRKNYRVCCGCKTPFRSN